MNYINSLTIDIQAKGLQDSSVRSQLHERGINYVYIGQRNGRVNSSGSLIKADQLLADPLFHLVYHQDLVWIFQILEP